MPQSPADQVRSNTDIALAAQIRTDPLVQTVLSQLAHDDRDTPQGVRRQLLATSLRLTPKMAPKLDALMQRCQERLGLQIPVETYVYSSPQFNAACVKPEQGQLFVLFSSSLLEAFDDDELAFVVGHELGHHLYQHHDIPVQHLLKHDPAPPPELALKLFAWSRYAEVSADRAGVLCAGDASGAAEALFRLASGLRTDMVAVVLDDFAAQAEEMRREQEAGIGSTASEWFSTHPFSPLRLEAIRAFRKSAFMVNDGIGKEVLEGEVGAIMGLMEPNYLDEQSSTAETMRRLLFAGAICVARADGKIHDKEKAQFEAFFASHRMDDSLNFDAIEQSLGERMSHAREVVPHARRVQVLRDLCLISQVDNERHPKERSMLSTIAEGLEVSQATLETLLNPTVELD